MNRADRVAVLRILGHYRRLVLLGKARLPLAEARRLVGPDCAYHLYFRHQTGGARRRQAQGRATRRRRSRPSGRRRQRR